MQSHSVDFTAWFGSSRVRDSRGAPLGVFHGTRVDFHAFEPNDRGIWFTSNADVAAGYALWQGEAEGCPLIIPAHLAISKPYRPTSQEHRAIESARSEDEGFEQLERVMVRRATELGHDGIFWDRETFAVFRPAQINWRLANPDAPLNDHHHTADLLAAAHAARNALEMLKKGPAAWTRTAK